MGPVTAAAVTTGLTVVRQLATPGPWGPDRAVAVSRTVIGGVLTGGVLIMIAQAREDLARGLGTVLVLTALLVNGAPVAEALLRVTRFTPTPAVDSDPQGN